ncbi:MAG TPA: exosome complex RNA-binding protein Rrp4 [archaeon]|nr:exosome complex RNA-binding protein Rrp4 [archaeon]
MTLLFEKNKFVTPGDQLAEGDFIPGNNTYRDGEKIFASRIGLANLDGKTVYVVAVKGCYVPNIGDFIIGKVIDMTTSGWIVDINSPYDAMLSVSEAVERQFNTQRDALSRIYNIGDLLMAKIIAYDRTRGPVLTTLDRGLGKITRGRVISITPTKIPRLIGKKGSMVNLLKTETNCYINVGQNGMVLISGSTPEDEDLAILAILKIEAEAHTSGLTERISALINDMKIKRGLTNVQSKTGETG